MAAIPLSIEFIEIMESLQLVIDEDQTADGYLVREAQPVTESSGVKYMIPSITLRQKTTTTIRTISLIDKLKKSLLLAGHPATEEIAIPILAIVCHLRTEGNERVKMLNTFLESVKEANVSHFFILPRFPSKSRFTFKGFKLGILDYEHFENLCKKSQSDFSDLYGFELKGSLALQSPVYKRNVIDFIPILIKENTASSQSRHAGSNELLLTYFEKLSRIHFDAMWDNLEELQHVISSLDNEIIGVESWRKIPVGQKVTIYLNFSTSGGGYVVPEGQALSINTPPPDGEIFVRLKELEDEFHMDRLGDSELSNTIKSFAKYAYEGVMCLRKQKFSESALNHFIALELLFSEKSSTSDKVCGRTAVFICLRQQLPFEKCFKRLATLYDLRSKYVHKGVPILREPAYEIDSVVKLVLKGLLLLNKKAHTSNVDFFEKWIKQLDWIRAGFEAGQEFPASTLDENGVT